MIPVLLGAGVGSFTIGAATARLAWLAGYRAGRRREAAWTASERRIMELERDLAIGAEPDLSGLPPHWRSLILLTRAWRSR
jgi:hypothetical protein